MTNMRDVHRAQIGLSLAKTTVYPQRASQERCWCPLLRCLPISKIEGARNIAQTIEGDAGNIYSQRLLPLCYVVGDLITYGYLCYIRLRTHNLSQRLLCSMLRAPSELVL